MDNYQRLKMEDAALTILYFELTSMFVREYNNLPQEDKKQLFIAIQDLERRLATIDPIFNA